MTVGAANQRAACWCLNQSESEEGGSWGLKAAIFPPVLEHGEGAKGLGKGKKHQPELTDLPAGRLPRFPPALTFLRCILGGGSEVAWSPAPAAREAAVAAAVLALADSVVTAVSPGLRHVCSGGASPAPAAAAVPRSVPLALPPGRGPHPRHVTARHLGAGHAPPAVTPRAAILDWGSASRAGRGCGRRHLGLGRGAAVGAAIFDKGMKPAVTEAAVLSEGRAELRRRRSFQSSLVV